jgi:16S rRNA (cytidine1402-2'-O)-methyltransferase
MPAVADPGASVVRAAHVLGLEVVPLAGPMSLMLALAASGLHGQSFAFVGYLPQESAARTVRLRALQAETQRSGQTQIFIETPYRNAALLQALLQALEPQTRLSVSAGLSLPDARTRSGTVAQWRQGGWTPDNQTPAVFLIGR